jgi:hypothetical protein
MEDREVALEAGKVLQEVFDVSGGQVVSNIIVGPNNLVVGKAEINQPARNFFERVVFKVPGRHILGERDAVSDSRVNAGE